MSSHHDLTSGPLNSIQQQQTENKSEARIIHRFTNAIQSASNTAEPVASDESVVYILMET